jgi:hypothetical protein
MVSTIEGVKAALATKEPAVHPHGFPARSLYLALVLDPVWLNTKAISDIFWHDPFARENAQRRKCLFARRVVAPSLHLQRRDPRRRVRPGRGLPAAPITMKCHVAVHHNMAIGAKTANFRKKLVAGSYLRYRE